MTLSPHDCLHNVHRLLLENEEIQGCDIEVVAGKYAYYHYQCDGLDDRGWGCGYRTCQTICSWVHYQKESHSSKTATDECRYGKVKGCVPSIPEVQKILVDLGDKPSSFMNSKEWIGSVEISMCLDSLYDVPCRLVHVAAGLLGKQLSVLQNHFRDYGSPVMMGGDTDNSSKGIFGVAVNPANQKTYLLVLDPHCAAHIKPQALVEEKWVLWRPLDQFDQQSFYNLCFPLLKGDES